MLKRILLAAALLGALAAGAHAQKTQSALQAEINTTFPDNISGAITPAGTRQFLNDFLASSVLQTGGSGFAVNPVWFGADPTGVNDSTAAFNAAAAAGTSIVFPAGKFRFASALSVTLPSSLSSFSIKGQGQDATTLFWPNAGGGLTINYSNTNYVNSAHISDLSFTTGQAAGGTGLTLTGNALTLGTTDLYRVTFRGDDGYNVTDYWTLGIAANFITDLNLEGVIVIGQGTLSGAATNLHGTGLSVIGNPTGSQYAVQINVAKSNFSALATGIQFGSFVQGLTVDQTNFTGVANGIIAPGGQTGTLAGLSVTNSQFGLYNTGGTNAIFASTTILNAMIANNFFFINSTASAANGVNFTNNCHFNIYGNQFASQGVANGQTAIYVNTALAACPSPAGVISGNDIFAWATGINLDTASKNTLVVGNTLEGNTTAFSNAGTGNITANNPGINPNIIIAGVSGKTLTIDNSLEFAGTDGTKFTFPTATDTVAGLAATQTLTNKTLTTPVIASISGNSGATGTLSTGTNGGTGGQLTLNGSTSGSAVVNVSATGTPQYGGTATNDNAPAGKIGEYQTASVSGVSLTSGTTANITSASLTAGDWEITGAIILAPAGALTGVIGLASLTTASLTPIEAGNFLQLNGTLGTGQGQTLPFPATRLSAASTTTVFCNVNAAFASTATGGCILRARRVR